MPLTRANIWAWSPPRYSTKASIYPRPMSPWCSPVRAPSANTCSFFAAFCASAKASRPCSTKSSHKTPLRTVLVRAGTATKPMRTSDADFGPLTYPLTRPRYLTPVSSTIGYWANKIHNVLFVTGDPPKMSPTYPRSTAVFDLDPVALVRFAQAYLNAGLVFSGQPLCSPQRPAPPHYNR